MQTFLSYVDLAAPVFTYRFKYIRHRVITLKSHRRMDILGSGGPTLFCSLFTKYLDVMMNVGGEWKQYLKCNYSFPFTFPFPSSLVLFLSFTFHFYPATVFFIIFLKWKIYNFPTLSPMPRAVFSFLLWKILQWSSGGLLPLAWFIWAICGCPV